MPGFEERGHNPCITEILATRKGRRCLWGALKEGDMVEQIHFEVRKEGCEGKG